MSFLRKLKGYTRHAFTLLWTPVDALLIRLVGRSGVLSSIYYILFSGAFRRECLGVLAGRRRYQVDHSGAMHSSPLLRRNVHRLEKGLIMRPRRDLFGVGYLDETVEMYVRMVAGDSCVFTEELKWSRDVLCEFFEVTRKDSSTDYARKLFEETEALNEARKPELIPYERDLESPAPVSYDAFLALSKLRRSVRWFLPKPVPHELLDLALTAAAESPSACNRQPFEFRFFDDPELLKTVTRIPMGTGGYEDNIPVFAVIIGKLGNYFDERDRHLIYIDGSLAAMSFAYAAETLGLSTCMINWPDIAEREKCMAEFLQLEADERPVMCMAIGYPDPTGMVPRSTKKSLEDLRKFN